VTRLQSGQLTTVFLVISNGPCFTAATFARYIDARPELAHVRTRRRSPQTHGHLGALSR
jgi:hypothetical protein